LYDEIRICIIKHPFFYIYNKAERAKAATSPTVAGAKCAAEAG